MNAPKKRRKRIGYTIGAEYPQGSISTPMPEKVFELTPEQTGLKARIEEAKAALERAEAEVERLEGEIERSVAECKHPVFNDHDMYPYYDRRCEICGTSIDRI